MWHAESVGGAGDVLPANPAVALLAVALRGRGSRFSVLPHPLSHLSASQMRAAPLLAVVSVAGVINGGSAQPTCFSSLAKRASEVNGECCDEPEEDCSSGRPATCNIGCARVLLPFFAECGSVLGMTAASEFEDVVVLCQSALPDWTPGQEPMIPLPKAPPDEYISRTFTYGKYYASDPDNPAAQDTTDNSCATAAA